MKKFFSLVLALVMALSLTTVAWGVDVTTEAALKAELEAGNDVVLKNDVATTGTITITGDVLLTAEPDATITANIGDDFVVENGGKLTLGAGVTIDSNTEAIWVKAGGTLVIDGATVTTSSDSYPAVLAYGEVYVEDDSTVYGSGNAEVIAASTGGKVFVNGGEVYSEKRSAMIIQNGGHSITINDGHVYAETAPYVAAYALCGTITVNGGVVDGSVTATAAGAAVVVKNGTVNGNVAAYGAATASAKIEGGVVNGTVYADDGADATISGGTFSVLPDESYLADGYTFIGDTVGVLSKGSSSVEGLYAKGTNDPVTAVPYAVEIVVTPAKAVKYNKTTGYIDEPGNVKYVNITGDGTYYMFVNTLAEADLVLFKDAAGKSVKYYLAEIETPYYAEAVAFNNFGDKCGQVDYDEDAGYDKELKYFTVKGFDGFEVFEEAEEGYGYDYVMYNNKLVPVVALGLDKVPHTAVTEYEDGELVKVYCSACDCVAVKAANRMSVPTGAVIAAQDGNAYWYWPVASTPAADEKVESAETFDAGIAMYVGMSVMAAAGSVVVLKKRED